ncbi:MAG TPA: flagellar basal body P-ring formation chaperone FlgA [Planctomicrobium sp.]|nr:flagellar basal body P-ring formation chaperone FlgA [Planctomicrobium sp.]
MREQQQCYMTASLWTALAVLVLSPVSVQAQERVAVRLKPTTVVSGSQVRLGDVADIIDNNPVRRAKLQDLDLADFNPQEPMTLDRDYIGIRVQLAGYERESVVLTGESLVKITAPAPVRLTDLGVEAAAFQELTRQFSVSPEDLNVKLTSPFMNGQNNDLENLSSPRIEVMRVPQLPLGRTQMTVRIMDGDRMVVSKLASFEVSIRQHVVVATMSLERNNQITPHNIQEEIRFIDKPVDRLAAQQLLGRRVLSPLKPGEVVTLRHVGDVIVEEAPVMILPRDPVRVTAKKGKLTVTIPVAEALQQGRQGQLIRVRNIQSNQIITGQVIGRGEVLVHLP